MKMGRKDPRASMSRSTRGQSPINPAGRNPVKSASPYETCGVGEDTTPRMRKSAPKPDPIAEDSASLEA